MLDCVGPFSTLEAATQTSRRERFDLAILDNNLNGKMVYPLPDELSARGLPFVFFEWVDLGRFAGQARQIAKPHDPAALIKTVRAAVPKAN